MKTFCLGLLLILTGCVSTGLKENILTINVEKNCSNVPLKLQDVAEVNYIKLANDSNFLVRSRALVMSDSYILTKGGEPGEILLFDKEGKALNKFSHFGNGPHEYNYITNLLLDEKRKEIYVHDVIFQKMFVYNLEGDFIREFPTGDGRYIYRLNDNAFLVYNSETNRVNPALMPYFSVISKEDGKILKKIDLPFASDRKYDLSVVKKNGEESFTYTAMHLPIIRNNDGYLLNELSSDTIYKFSANMTLSPFMARTPSISTMSTPVFLESGVETTRYIFMTKIAVNEQDERNMFPSTNWVYDKESGTLCEYTMTNEDYPEEKILLESHIVNCDIQPGWGISRFNADKLIEAYHEDKLVGKLKEVASTLQEEDNDVLMVMRFK